MPEPAITERAVQSTEERDTRLAKIFHETFRNQSMAPEWGWASHKYRLAVAAGVRAILKEIGIK